MNHRINMNRTTNTTDTTDTTDTTNIEEESSSAWARRLLANNPTTLCTDCANPVRRERAALGYTTCLPCGERAAKKARMGWCVVQTYGKGGYQYVTPEAAKAILHNTNQKNTRGEFK